MSLSRRTFLAACGALSLTGGLAAGQAQAAIPRFPLRDPVKVGDTMFVDVTAATLWCGTTTDGTMKLDYHPRTIDAPSLTNPVDLRAWNASMETDERLWLSGNSVLESQAVMGTKVIVTEVHGDWVKVIIPGQPTPRASGNFGSMNGYPGYVPTCQLVKNPSFEQALSVAPLATVKRTSTWLTADKAGARQTTELSFNTVLPVRDRCRGWVRLLRPNGAEEWLRQSNVIVRPSGVTPNRPTGEEIVETGMKLLGIRYLWAGVSSFGFDCSGFTYTCYRHHGITLNRDANPQMRYSNGQVIESGPLSSGEINYTHYNLSGWQPGDLVFFRGRAADMGSGNASHVGIYAGTSPTTGPVILHSPGSHTVVNLEPLSEILVGRMVVGIRRYV